MFKVNKSKDRSAVIVSADHSQIIITFNHEQSTYDKGGLFIFGNLNAGGCISLIHFSRYGGCELNNAIANDNISIADYQVLENESILKINVPQWAVLRIESTDPFSYSLS